MHLRFRRPDLLRLFEVLAVCLICSGCLSSGIQREAARLSSLDMPRELEKVTLPIYRVEPPDILLIEAVNNTRPAWDVLRTGDELLIQVANGLPLDAEADPIKNPAEFQIQMEFEREFKIINRVYKVGADGNVDLGPKYGQVHVAGLTLMQAKDAVEKHLREKVRLKAPLVALSMSDVSGKQTINGEHLVRLDGTVSLGIYGSVLVVGMTLDEVKATVEQHLARFINKPEVNVDVLSYNSKVYYIITDGGGRGEEVVRLPSTGNETVLDAISQIDGLSEVSSKKIWIARPGPSGTNRAQILDVHWSAITAEGITATNYQILPGDRIFIEADHLIAMDNFIAKVTAPVERIFGVILLGSGVQSTLRFLHINNRGGFGGGGGGGGP